MLAVGWLLVAILVAEPFVGLAFWRRFRRELASRADARLRLYRRTITLEWGYVALVAITVAAVAQPLAALGLVRPTLTRIPESVRGGLVGVAIGVLVALVVPVLTARGRAFMQDALGEAAALLPANARERGWFVALSLTAGFCEELLYRGFLFFWIARFWPSVSGAVIVSALVFGVAHLYQGVRGLIGTAILGGLLGALYVWTGSLWVPIALHALIDLRAALLTPPAAASDRAAA